MTDEEFEAAYADPDQKIANCEVFHDSRLDPASGLQAPRMSWMRRARPVRRGRSWRVQVDPWTRLSIPTYSTRELLRGVERVKPLLTDAERRRAVGGTEQGRGAGT